MDEERKRHFIHVLFHLAWADDGIQEEERQSLSEVLTRMDIPASLEDTIAEWFEEPPGEPQWEAFRDDEELREPLIRQAALMAAIDETIKYEETMALEKLRQELGYSEREFAQIQKDIEQLVASSDR